MEHAASSIPVNDSMEARIFAELQDRIVGDSGMISSPEELHTLRMRRINPFSRHASGVGCCQIPR